MLFHGQEQDALKSFVISVLLEQRQARHGTIQDVVHETSRSLSRSAWHASQDRPLTRRASRESNGKELRPLFILCASALAGLGGNLLLQQGHVEAEQTLREALAIFEKEQPDAWSTFQTRSLLGGALLGQQKYADAQPLLLAGYQGLKQREAEIPAKSKKLLTEALQRLVRLYDAWGKPEQAEAWRQRLVERADSKSP
jgi:hypothetical protein